MQAAATASPMLEAKADAPEQVAPHTSYFDQIMPAPPTVCGLRLKPLSIGRYRLMARFKVAFVAEQEAIATAGDLLMGVLICSMDYDAFVKCAEQPDFKKQIQKWGRRFGFFPPKFLSWRFIGPWLSKKAADSIAKSDASFLATQMQLFLTYIKEGQQSPPYFDESPGGRVSGAHWSHSIEAVLRESQGWTKQEINEEPLTKALWDFYKHMENAGMVRLMTDAEMAQINQPMPVEQEDEWEKYLRLVAEAKAKEGANG